MPVRISELPPASLPLVGDEQVPLEQGGTTKKAPASAVVPQAQLDLLQQEIDDVEADVTALTGTVGGLQDQVDGLATVPTDTYPPLINISLAFDGGAVVGKNFWMVMITESGNANANIGGALTGSGSTSEVPHDPASTFLINQLTFQQSVSGGAINASAARLAQNDHLFMYNTISGRVNGGGGQMWLRGAWRSCKATQRAFVGLKPGIGSLGTTVDPSATLNIIGFGKDSGDTNLFLMHNDGTGTATKVDTGIAFVSGFDECMFDCFIFIPAQGGVAVCQIFNRQTGTSFQATISTDLPVQDQGLLPIVWANSGPSDATVIRACFSRVAMWRS